VSDALTGQVDIGMVSRPIREEEIQLGSFYIAVTKDAVVATVNSSNPVLDEIFSQGLSQTDLRKIFLRETTRWCEVVGEDCPPSQKDKIIVYGRSDASGAAKVWASFLGDLTQSELQDKADANFNGDQPLAHAVNREKNSICFNNLNYVYNPTTGEFAGNIRPIPLDQNGNNVLEAKENFYMNRNTFVENVSAGNYPSPPARLEYLLSKGPFTGRVKEFVSWILTEGQKYVEESGYVRLSEEKLSQEIDFLEKGIRE
ncbi:MAG: PstS family phosphate ABC transporter substrate-binding protein, partial [Candidatus Bipolaricaulia bacterium]